MTARSLREAIALVPQEPTLFGGTVYENIVYGRLDASRGEVEMAAWAANAHAFIMALPHGYDTIVGERGVRLSGGQRQRLAIARAILKRPRLLILDEATSALDNEAEGLVQDAVQRLMGDCTTLIIAHRFTTVERADKIIVLERGRVVQEGAPGDLLAHESLYTRLSMQNSPARRPDHTRRRLEAIQAADWPPAPRHAHGTTVADDGTSAPDDG